MAELVLKQLQYETDTWKRQLGFITEENIYLKNRLSEILKNNFDNKLLAEVEDFQNSFVREDELIALLRKDVAVLDRLLNEEIFQDGGVITDIGKTIKKIRQNMSIAEMQFSKLKNEFNSYLSENL